ncbi:Gfo/Idh/MocA family oxidoreductase [Thiocapsa roseopersicina]|uniref:Oxidoreductase family, NAD-binding Rossmann fold n=1 Tax=Thiocapsa roseopersicina TaxID=1058 RepID=A0A1H2X7G6_THIRO|nr:Gfo/Idh/MocA family oxidoreductase [Thiocapsa roseopersicina]SDW88820.1 Oxidoreductase family, NAD-binding Rossmann fold [Thiocapsa roseopersicina]
MGAKTPPEPSDAVSSGLSRHKIVPTGTDTTIPEDSPGIGFGYAGATFHAPLIVAVLGLRLAAIDLAAPNATHHPLAAEALAAGKHVVVDKPFTLNVGPVPVRHARISPGSATTPSSTTCSIQCCDMRYEGLRVVLHASALAAEPAPRFVLHSTGGAINRRIRHDRSAGPPCAPDVLVNSPHSWSSSAPPPLDSEE